MILRMFLTGTETSSALSAKIIFLTDLMHKSVKM